MLGICRLCSLEKPLVRSHFLPAGIYRRLRDKTEGNPNPWMASKGRKPIQSSRQEWAYLLCSDCEQLFSRNGENWVLGHCIQENGGFPLASILNLRLPRVKQESSPTKLYFAADIPEIDVPALAYFAASMFWRGSVYGWNNDGSVPIKLGPFEKAFREYLLGQRDFPDNCYLVVAVREGDFSDMITYSPISRRTGIFHSHRFPIPGLAFTLLVSKNMPSDYRRLCIVHGPGNPIVVTSIIEQFIIEDVAKLFRPLNARKQG